MQLGRVGIWQRRHEVSAHAAQEIEALGNTALWLGASPDPADARPFLQQISTLIEATGILNVWQQEPTEVAALHAELTSAFSGPVLLGVGIGHPEATSADAGATVLMEVEDPLWGDRFGRVQDPFGHSWSIATHVRTLLRRRSPSAPRRRWAT
jgi:hypothetical protein